MKKFARFGYAFFLALGAMISLCPREGRTQTYSKANDDSGIEYSFIAAWNFLEEAIASDEK